MFLIVAVVLGPGLAVNHFGDALKERDSAMKVLTDFLRGKLSSVFI